MAWARVQSKSVTSTNVASGATATQAFGTTPTVGNKIIFYVAGVSQSSSSTSMTFTLKDSAGTLLTQLATLNNGTGTFVYSQYIFAYDFPSGPTATFTLTGTTSTGAWQSSWLGQEISGLITGNTTAMLDGSIATAGPTGTSPLAPSYSSTASNEFAFTFYGDWGNSATATVPTGWTADANNINTNANDDCMVGYKNSVNGAETSSWAFTTAGNVAIGMTGAIKLPGGGGGGLTGVSPLVLPSRAAQQGSRI